MVQIACSGSPRNACIRLVSTLLETAMHTNTAPRLPSLDQPELYLLTHVQHSHLVSSITIYISTMPRLQQSLIMAASILAGIKYSRAGHL